MLQFEQSWRFTSPGEARKDWSAHFLEFIEKIAAQGDSWRIVAACCMDRREGGSNPDPI